MPEPRLAAAQWRDPAVFVCTLGGIGFLRPAPGTWGSALAVLLWWPLTAATGSGGSAWVVQLGLIAAAIVVGLLAIGAVARRFGVHDDGAIVIDELAGVWLALVAVPRDGWWFALGFALFRLFDIWKPWPVSWADRSVPGAPGVMLDDLIAGALAAGVLQFTIRVLV